FVGLYWAYCLVSAALGARSLLATGANILGRQQMAPWVVVAAVTAVSFSGWAVIALCFWPYLTRMGGVLGLIAGLMTVTIAELSGLGWLDTSSLRGWEHWLLAAHPAGLGILVNLAVVISVSAITGDHRLDLERKLAFHGTLREHAALPADRRPFVPMAWMITLIWFFFAIGPGVVIGNWIFGDPAQPASWFFGMPSIWAWQFLFWALGVGMVGFLAYVMQMSTGPETEVEALANDIAELEALLRG
ncbi:MAG: hypothetical protein ACR2Q4_18635, partial [Geminicoccaceae bacterium]